MKRLAYCLSACAAVFLFATLARADVIVAHARVRMPPPAADTAAAYMTLHNDGDKDEAIAGLTTDVSRTAEIHSITGQGGAMHMVKLGKLTIPAHGAVMLKSGGVHIMLIGLKRALNEGDMVHIRLRLTSGRDLNIEAGVRDMRPHGEPAEVIYERAMAMMKAERFTDAAGLFRQAAGQGNRRAQYQLGLLYARGDGVRKNLVKAREWLYKAAMQGHPKAQFYLGQMYAFGDGGRQDNVKATMWFWLATTFGDRYAKDSLRVMTGKIAPHELIEAKKLARALWREMPHDMKIERGMTMH